MLPPVFINSEAALVSRVLRHRDSVDSLNNLARPLCTLNDSATRLSDVFAIHAFTPIFFYLLAPFEAAVLFPAERGLGGMKENDRKK